MIPRRIIQTHKGRDLPLLERAAVATVKAHARDFEYIFFDDQEVADFMNSECHELRALFYAFPYRIQRYDFFRYLAVYRLGGFYFDTDILVGSELTALTGYSSVFAFERLTWSDFLREKYGMDWEIGNYAFGAAAGHPFLAAIIDNCLRAQREPGWSAAMVDEYPRLVRKQFEVLCTTGPGLVSRTFAEGPRGADEIRFLFPEDICDRRGWNRFGDFAIHLMQSSWRQPYGPVRRRLVNLLMERNERRAMRWTRAYGGHNLRSADRTRLSVGRDLAV